MLVPCTFEQDRDRAATPVDIAQTHSKNTMPAMLAAPVTDPLARAEQKRHDRPVAGAGLRDRDPFSDRRIEVLRKHTWFPATEIQPGTAGRQVPAPHSVKRPGLTGWDWVLQFAPTTASALSIPLDQESVKRRKGREPVVHCPGGPRPIRPVKASRERTDILPDQRPGHFIQRLRTQPSSEMLHAETVRPDRVAATTQDNKPLHELLNIIHARPPIVGTGKPISHRLLRQELGYMELDRRGAELLFQVLTEREEKNSIAIASNESFSGWTKTFSDPRLCAAIVDRLTFNGTIIETGTDSYRLAHTIAQQTTS